MEKETDDNEMAKGMGNNPVVKGKLEIQSNGGDQEGNGREGDRDIHGETRKKIKANEEEGEGEEGKGECELGGKEQEGKEQEGEQGKGELEGKSDQEELEGKRETEIKREMEKSDQEQEGKSDQEQEGKGKEKSAQEKKETAIEANSEATSKKEAPETNIFKIKTGKKQTNIKSSFLESKFLKKEEGKFPEIKNSNFKEGGKGLNLFSARVSVYYSDLMNEKEGNLKGDEGKGVDCKEGERRETEGKDATETETEGKDATEKESHSVNEKESSRDTPKPADSPLRSSPKSANDSSQWTLLDFGEIQLENETFKFIRDAFKTLLLKFELKKARFINEPDFVYFDLEIRKEGETIKRRYKIEFERGKDKEGFVSLL